MKEKKTTNSSSITALFHLISMEKGSYIWITFQILIDNWAYSISIQIRSELSSNSSKPMATLPTSNYSRPRTKITISISSMCRMTPSLWDTTWRIKNIRKSAGLCSQWSASKWRRISLERETLICWIGRRKISSREPMILSILSVLLKERTFGALLIKANKEIPLKRCTLTSEKRSFCLKNTNGPQEIGLEWDTDITFATMATN